MDVLKACTKCGEKYPATTDFFYWHKKNNLLRPQCKKCHGEAVLATRKDTCQRELCQKSLACSQRRGFCSTACRILVRMGDIGARYGRLVVQGYAGQQENGHSMLACLCDCGTEKDIWIYHLRIGQTQSCGCLHRDIMKARVGDKHSRW